MRGLQVTCPTGTVKKREIKKVKTFCKINMKKLKKITKLNINDLIQARVQASNKYCKGDYSTVNIMG